MDVASAVVEVTQLAKRYGSVEALRGLDLRVREGEVYGFLGRNGAGKSTTIRILMGITRASGGSVRMFGEDGGRDLVRWRQRIGYVAQEQSFYGWMSGEQLGHFVSGFFPRWDHAEMRRLAQKLDVPLARKVRELSGGTRVKLALALALAHRPPLLLLDEPTAGLDPVARREFLEIVKGETRESGRTTFFSSHLIDEIEMVASRVGIVDAGRTRYEGDVEALRERVRVLRRAWRGVEDAELLRRELGATGVRVLHEELAGAPLADVRDLSASEDAPREHRVYVESDAERLDALALQREGETLEHLPLEEIFIAMVRRKTA